MLLSIDWDAYSATRELVFDAPIWGTPDREYDRLEAWRARLRKRGGVAQEQATLDWNALEEDFPLLGDWQALLQFQGKPAWAALSHAAAYDWVSRFEPQDVLNIDSHHDLYSSSGDPARVRPGNWAGLALRSGRITSYVCQYPEWHADLRVAEGYDLERTRAELTSHLPPPLHERLQLRRSAALPDPEQVTALLLVQSPSWCSPAHDPAFLSLVEGLGAKRLETLRETETRLERPAPSS